MLSALDHGTELSEEEISSMTWEQKVKLIKKDPLTWSLYFDHRVQKFIKVVLKSSHDFLGKITEYFYRLGFQQSGFPHIHIIVWVENAPNYNSRTNEEITTYADKYLKCCSDEAPLHDLIQLQIHKHSRTCRKKAYRVCRFGYPLPPLNRTIRTARYWCWKI